MPHTSPLVHDDVASPGVVVVASVTSHQQPLGLPSSLAILPFEDYSNRIDLAWLQQGLPNMLITDLALIPDLHIVSRYHLGEVLREQWLQQRGSFKETPSVTIGRLTGARYLLSGLFYMVNTDLVVETHLLDVEQGSVIRAIRVKGAIHAIPTLEMDLSRRLAQIFRVEQTTQLSTSQSNPTPLKVVEEGESISTRSSTSLTHMDIDPVGMLPLASSPYLRMDTILSLERVQHIREDAMRVTEQIWHEGIRVQLGRPKHQVESLVAHNGVVGMTIRVPVSVWVSPERLKQLSPDIQLVQSTTSVHAKGLTVTYHSEDPGTQRLFVESLEQPRRVFVRALGSSDEVLAVFSRGHWRVDHYVEQQENGRIQFPVASSPFISGAAQFSGQLIASHHSVERFDAVIVPVPEEARLVMVEEVREEKDQEIVENDRGDHVIPKTHHTTAILNTSIGKRIRSWILDHWDPPVAEALPVPGYLPGNRRQGIVLASGGQGTISNIHFLHLPMEDGFADSIRQVLMALREQCFDSCPHDERKSDANHTDSYQFRIQFELVKDVRYVGFNQ